MTLPDNNTHYRLIERAIQVLEKESSYLTTDPHNTDHRLTALANQLHVSPSHLQRVFTSWAGISPKQFFQCLQKNHARDLLYRQQSILATATEMGYASTSKLHHLMIKFEALTPGEIKLKGQGQVFTIGKSNSPFGQVFLCQTSKGINSLEFETENLSYETWQKGILQLYPEAQFVESTEQTQAVINQIFPVEIDNSATLKLHLRGTTFQLQVWQALLHITEAQFCSYQQIAVSLGKPTASRAVGSAIAKNPIAYLIPCHRVIQATGDLGQYRWHSTRKKALHIWEQGLMAKI